jgi:uncharacterized protein YndB with AHSA1/START domain
VSCYVVDYAARFDFGVPPGLVWSAIEDLNQFETWWGWLGNLKVEGDGLREGSVLRGTVAPPLPYRMRLRVELTRCDPNRLIDAIVDGDLKGEAHIGFEPHGDGTRTDVSWTLEMMNRPMRMAAPFAYPLLRWGHDRVVEATVNGFRNHIEHQ